MVLRPRGRRQPPPPGRALRPGRAGSQPQPRVSGLRRGRLPRPRSSGAPAHAPRTRGPSAARAPRGGPKSLPEQSPAPPPRVSSARGSPFLSTPLLVAGALPRSLPPARPPARSHTLPTRRFPRCAPARLSSPLLPLQLSPSPGRDRAPTCPGPAPGYRWAPPQRSSGKGKEPLWPSWGSKRWSQRTSN